jgi:putative phosphoesterase
MRILVISDTHRKLKNVIELLQGNHKFDRIFHLGDLVGDAQDLESIFNIPVDYVAGNCDWGQTQPYEKVVEIQEKIFLLTHGHHFFVKSGTHMLHELAKKEEHDVIMYGHTHEAKIEYEKKCVIFNPGSISLPRDGSPSFGVINIDSQGKIVVNIARIK